MSIVIANHCAIVLNKQDDFMSGPYEDVEKESARLRKENRLLREERELPKKATVFFAGQKG